MYVDKGTRKQTKEVAGCVGGDNTLLHGESKNMLMDMLWFVGLCMHAHGRACASPLPQGTAGHGGLGSLQEGGTVLRNREAYFPLCALKCACMRACVCVTIGTDCFS